MKIIAIEISVEHCPDAPEDAIPVEQETAGPQRETFALSISQEVPDGQPVAEFIQKANAELMRRYWSLNARKTN
jgi:hypothetical protein